MRILSFAFAALITAPAMAAEPTAQEINTKIVELMETTQVSMLEVVYLKNKKDGPSRVSEDGEVIFLYKASDRKHQALITEAFTIRARRALGN